MDRLHNQMNSVSKQWCIKMYARMFLLLSLIFYHFYVTKHLHRIYLCRDCKFTWKMQQCSLVYVLVFESVYMVINLEKFSWYLQIQCSCPMQNMQIFLSKQNICTSTVWYMKCIYMYVYDVMEIYSDKVCSSDIFWLNIPYMYTVLDKWVKDCDFEAEK